jgi:hypothetical protein
VDKKSCWSLNTRGYAICTHLTKFCGGGGYWLLGMGCFQQHGFHFFKHSVYNLKLIKLFIYIYLDTFLAFYWQWKPC